MKNDKEGKTMVEDPGEVAEKQPEHSVRELDEAFRQTGNPWFAAKAGILYFNGAGSAQKNEKEAEFRFDLSDGASLARLAEQLRDNGNGKTDLDLCFLILKHGVRKRNRKAAHLLADLLKTNGSSFGLGERDRMRLIGFLEKFSEEGSPES